MMAAQDLSRFTEAAREYAEADDAMDFLTPGAAEGYTERYQRRREAQKRYRRELHRLGF